METIHIQEDSHAWNSSIIYCMIPRPESLSKPVFEDNYVGFAIFSVESYGSLCPRGVDQKKFLIVVRASRKSV